MNKQNISERKIMLLLYLIVFGITAISGSLLHVAQVVDEAGTLANAMHLSGHTWTDAMDGIGGYYYKYGTVFFYYPLTLLIKDAVVLYKAIMILHTALISFIPVIAYTILRRHLKVNSALKAALSSLAVGLIPAVLLQSLYIRADIFLYFIPWLALLLLLECNRLRNANKKVFILFSSMLGLLSVYAYACHTRGIVVILAVIVSIIFIRVILRITVIHPYSFVGSLAIGLLLDRLLTSYFKNAIWGIGGTRHSSVESFDFEALTKIFTKSGMLSLIKLIMGWIFTVITSTAGIVAIGVIAAFIIFYYLIRKRSMITDEEGIVTIFSLISFSGTFAMGILFFFQFVHRFFLGKSTVRADRILYDRYIIGVAGLLCLLGLYVVLFRKDLFGFKAKMISIICCVFTVFFFGAFLGKYILDKSYTTRYSISLNTFLNMKYGGTTGNYPDIVDAYLWMGIASFIILLLFLILLYKKKVLIGCMLIIVFYASVYGVNYYKVRYARNDVVYHRMVDVKEFMQDISEITDEYNDVLVQKGATQIKIYQVALPQYNFIVPRMAKDRDISNIFIIAKQKQLDYLYYEEDFYSIDQFEQQSKSRDRIYIKGESLKKVLEEMGYTLTKMSLPSN